MERMPRCNAGSSCATMMTLIKRIFCLRRVSPFLKLQITGWSKNPSTKYQVFIFFAIWFPPAFSLCLIHERFCVELQELSFVFLDSGDIVLLIFYAQKFTTKHVTSITFETAKYM